VPLKYLKDVVTLELDEELCVGCGMCLEVCPHAVFVLGERKAHIVERDACMECGACARNCPVGAISVQAGVGCAAAVINSILYGGEPSCDCDSGDGGACCG
jgi:NAD-dependent dihydropyrimidine dehydrogenase PreA subunit